MRACKILAISGCPLWRQWQPAGYTCLEDISYNRMPNSSYLTFMAILTASKVWLPIGTCEIFLPVRYCSLWDMATCEILLPARYCYLQEMATCKILLPARNGYLQDIATNEKWLPARYCFQRDYCCQRDISYNRISVSPNLTYPATLPASEVWLPMRYACL